MTTRRRTNLSEVLQFEEKASRFSLTPSKILVATLSILTGILLGYLAIQFMSVRSKAKLSLFIYRHSLDEADLLFAVIIALFLLLYFLYQLFLTKTITIDDQNFYYGRRKISLPQWKEVLLEKEVTVMRQAFIRLPTTGRDIVLTNSKRLDNLEYLIWCLEEALEIPLYLNFTGNISEYESSPHQIKVIDSLDEINKYRAKESLKSAAGFLAVTIFLLGLFLYERTPEESVLPVVVVGIVSLLALVWLVLEIKTIIRPNKQILGQLLKNEPVDSEANALLYTLHQDYSTATFFCGLPMGAKYIYGEDYIFEFSNITTMSLWGYIKTSNRKKPSGLYMTISFEDRMERILDYQIRCRHVKDYYRLLEIPSYLQKRNPTIQRELDDEIHEIAIDYFQERK